MRTLISALTALLVIDSTERRRQLDTQLAEEKRQLERERRDLEARRKAAKRERQRLTIQRIYDALRTSLAGCKCGQFDLAAMVGIDTINKFAAQVTNIAAREIQRDDLTHAALERSSTEGRIGRYMPHWRDAPRRGRGG